MNGERISSESPGLNQAFRDARTTQADQHDDPTATGHPPLLHTVAASPVPIVVIDTDMSVRLWNPAAERLFGCTKEEVSGGWFPIVSFADHDERCTPVAEEEALAGDRSVAPERDARRLLQTITDAATLISGAQFGAASYNVADGEGGRYLLYSLSGAPRQPLAASAIPRRTIGFAPTLAGETVARSSGAVIKDLWYDGNMRHARSSPEHAPVTNFLAVPMVGRSGEVLGGLFLNHPDPDVLTEDSKRVVMALATCAAIAIDNAGLHEAALRTRTAAEAANRSKDEFLAVLAHELRNPLSTVRGSIVTAHLDPAQRDRALELARRGAEQLTRLVDDMLDVARIAQGKITLRREAVALAHIVERAIDGARQLIEDRGHAVSVSPLDRNICVKGDALRLEQVIGNLLANAAKYMNPGGQIMVTVAHEDDEAVVRVRDTGMGIAPEVLPHVFELFTQAEQSVDHAQGGLGIGLALVKRLVELHGGCVEAHSDGRGRGAEFVVRLRAVGPADTASIPR